MSTVGSSWRVRTEVVEVALPLYYYCSTTITSAYKAAKMEPGALSSLHRTSEQLSRRTRPGCLKK